MPVKQIYSVTGYLSIILGIIGTALISRLSWMNYAIICAFFGMVSAIINIFLNAKYFSEQERMPKGYFGLFMSSLPIVFLMLIIFVFRPKA